MTDHWFPKHQLVLQLERADQPNESKPLKPPKRSQKTKATNQSKKKMKLGEKRGWNQREVKHPDLSCPQPGRPPDGFCETATGSASSSWTVEGGPGWMKGGNKSGRSRWEKQEGCVCVCFFAVMFYVYCGFLVLVWFVFMIVVVFRVLLLDYSTAFLLLPPWCSSLASPHVVGDLITFPWLKSESAGSKWLG